MSLPLPVGLSDSIKRIIDTPVADTGGIYKQFKVTDSLDLVRTLLRVLSRTFTATVDINATEKAADLAGSLGFGFITNAIDSTTDNSYAMVMARKI
ncbi:hypothetical protein HZ326_9062 [Fusarium oxysporum f. sp. albedinis]|nr:hypothetical protein HZ326_9062 [Fusarium oxysporum f. sp. albedinis]